MEMNNMEPYVTERLLGELPVSYLNRLSLKFVVQDNFTVAIITDVRSPAVFVGVAKKSPRDRASMSIGRAVSANRAFKKLLAFAKEANPMVRGVLVEKEEAPDGSRA